MTAARLSLPTLRGRNHPLASSGEQLRQLEEIPLARSFEASVRDAGAGALRRAATTTLQLNLGKVCNQTCRHCHVDAGPDRRERMSDDVLDRALDLIDSGQFGALDLTGGAPELHPRFRELVRHARARSLHVMDRCNLTITQLPSHADLPDFLCEHGVEVVASLPWWRSQETDAQRGERVFERSLAALRRFNTLGYGRDPRLILTLVTNPVGAFLPPDQASLERDYRRELSRRYGVEFTRLFTITNMPISRYLEWLTDTHRLHGYMNKLAASFNPRTLDGLMCRNTLSVGWDGRLYDCDFNQMLELALPESIFDLQPDTLFGRAIRTGPHCFGCTAGAGSSCGGATVRE